MQVLFVEGDAMSGHVVKDMLRVVGANMGAAPDAETGETIKDRCCIGRRVAKASSDEMILN